MAEEVKGAHHCAKSDASKKDSDCKCFFAKNKYAGYGTVGAICLIIGLLIGSFFLGGPSAGLGVSTVPESGLDKTIATYNYNGKHNITIRELMEAYSTVDMFKTTDPEGNEVYRVPSSDSVISYVRTRVIDNLADSKGIKISDEELAEAIKNTYNVEGDENIDALAKQFGVDTPKFKTLMTQQLKGEKLIKSYMGDEKDIPAAPEQPKTPEKDAEKTPTEEYAQYIINLVGSAWDGAAGKWADDESPYAKTLVGDMAFDGQKATFSQASVVFSIASQTHQEAVAKSQMAAFEEINKAMNSTSVTILTIGQ